MPDYRVQLDTFSGPLDLLLYLVRRNEIDLVDLPISQITNQFLAFLQILELIDLDTVGEFVVMASTLIEIKSRLVLPRSDDQSQEAQAAMGEDPRSELVEQLLEYKRYRDAGQALQTHADEWHTRFPRLASEKPKSARDAANDSFKEVELWDLVSALARVMQKKIVVETSSIRYDDTPISVYVERIGSRVRSMGRAAFSEFFEGANERSKIVGIFLAILELLRHHNFHAEQPAPHGEIYLTAPIPVADNPPTDGVSPSVDGN
ncbi:MAG: chromosome segregation protein ScpA [Planctomyces sp.]|jgi:segregation and condensation protein A|nr:chromosome segregation protein ScpA [Planctomyces sp.]